MVVLTPFRFGLASLGQVPPCFCPSFVRPRKTNLSPFDVRYPSITLDPVHLKARFQEEEPSVVIAQESNLRETKNQNPVGKTRAVMI